MGKLVNPISEVTNRVKHIGNKAFFIVVNANFVCRAWESSCLVYYQYL